MNVEELKSAWSKGERPEAPGADLYGANLYGASLTRANLTGANLGGANLTNADLTGADLYCADLRGANLTGADLTRAFMAGADLTGANLTGAFLLGTNLGPFAALTGGILEINGLPSGNVLLVPTPAGWQITIGCWRGDLQSLKELITGDTCWPEATGDEITLRRPSLEMVIALAEDHAKRHPTRVDDLAKYWTP